jgi:hypothetical protein
VRVVTRHLLPTVLIAIALALMIGFFAFARPQYHPETHENIKVPPEHPATAGWTWAEGTPGFKAGTMLGKHHDFNISGLQPVEIASAQLAAAHSLLDADGVRVLESLRTDKRGPVALLAAPTVEVTPTQTCLAVMLRGSAPVTWRCPQDLLGTHVLGVVVAGNFSSSSGHPLFVMGVARADVQRIVLVGAPSSNTTVYTRGATWGQFEASTAPTKRITLLVYGEHGLLEKLILSDPPGGQRSFD